MIASKIISAMRRIYNSIQILHLPSQLKAYAPLISCCSQLPAHAHPNNCIVPCATHYNWYDILKMLEAPSLSIKLPDCHRILEQRDLE